MSRERSESPANPEPPSGWHWIEEADKSEALIAGSFRGFMVLYPYVAAWSDEGYWGFLMTDGSVRKVSPQPNVFASWRENSFDAL